MYMDALIYSYMHVFSNETQNTRYNMAPPTKNSDSVTLMFREGTPNGTSGSLYGTDN